MLSEQTRDIVKATVPVLEQHGTTITTVFYRNMLSEHKELLNIFNKTNQSRGLQPTALATTVLAAAKHIDNLGALAPYVVEIGHKHRALQVLPEHYPIVGKHLLGAIKEVLGDAATVDILNAWTEAYGAIAQIFIDVEANLYRKAAWGGWKPFKVAERTNVAKEVVEFKAVPSENSGIDLSKISFAPGQYVTVKTHPTNDNNQYDALRHYSICSSSAANGLKFAVKREHDGDHSGLVSTYLHDSVKEGDLIYLSAPAGDFALDNNLTRQNEIPLVLLSAGVGVTPLVSMLEEQIETNPSRPIIWVQTSFNRENQPFASRVEDLLKKCSNATIHSVHTQTMPRIDNAYLSEKLPDHSDIYVCGSSQFMSEMIKMLKKLEYKDERIHYEPFGPKMATELLSDY
ncbi:LAQU0S12e00364g1_1 [Lachancea quebecensis]|uniref:nitric oxide dioxygenase n=1 Tax=Lachancea quebecensis TaxID=1654605 RepID=A0A0P1L2T1_9SACH|nr:LAQU0S12e00364g1_1 [Lachancea quebecensis]